MATTTTAKSANAVLRPTRSAPKPMTTLGAPNPT